MIGILREGIMFFFEGNTNYKTVGSWAFRFMTPPHVTLGGAPR